jgi:hypothetical protein
MTYKKNKVFCTNCLFQSLINDLTGIYVWKYDVIVISA